MRGPACTLENAYSEFDVCDPLGPDASLGMGDLNCLDALAVRSLEAIPRVHPSLMSSSTTMESSLTSTRCDGADRPLEYTPSTPSCIAARLTNGDRNGALSFLCSISWDAGADCFGLGGDVHSVFCLRRRHENAFIAHTFYSAHQIFEWFSIETIRRVYLL